MKTTLFFDNYNDLSGVFGNINLYTLIKGHYFLPCDKFSFDEKDL